MEYEPTPLMAPESHYDARAARRVELFIEQLKHTKGDFYDEPFLLLDWQRRLIRDVFGTLRPNGCRQFKTAFAEIPKKMGKSELGAAIALYMLSADGEQRAEVYGCAADRGQASLIFDVACDMIKLCPDLERRCRIMKSRKTIEYLPTESKYVALSSDVGGKSGVNVSALIFDELWVQKDRDFFDMMTKGTSDARKNPLHFIITTAGDDEHSVCYSMHQKAEDILAGRKIDKTFYPVIYAADKNDDWSDPEVWKKANPSLGYTVPIETVKEAYESAAMDPAEENKFKQLRLNIWVKSSIRWMPMDRWDMCDAMVDPDELEGRDCYGGLDLATTTDITSLSLVFPPVTDDEPYYIMPFFWVPEESMKTRVKRDHVPYDVWEKQGHLLTTPGDVVHYDFIEKFIGDLRERYNILELAFDRWQSVQMMLRLEDAGMTVIQFGQGMKSMSPPTKDLLKLVLENKIAHGGHPILRWNMENVVVRQDAAGNIKPDKEKSREKIDGAVATIMALDRAVRWRENVGRSVYEDRGIISFSW